MIRSLKILTLAAAVWETHIACQADDDPRPAAPPVATDGAEISNPEHHPPRPPSAEEIRNWIADLGNDRFDVREEATKRLERAGAGAIAPLVESAEGPILEKTCRAIRALEGIAQNGDRPTFEAAQASLEALAGAKNRSVARRAGVALLGLVDVRRKHSIGRIIELGAIIKRPSMPRGIIIPDDEDVGAAQVILGKRWKGGDEGLAYLRRIDELRTLYITKGAAVSDEAVAELQRALPNLRVQFRGAAMLGVACSSLGKGCIVETVAPGSAAEKAGLQEGDMIVKYDGEELTDFDRLIEITGKHSAGDAIVIEVERDGKTLSIEAELGEWQ